MIPRPPAHIQPYVDAFGLHQTITFLLHFGGAELYIAGRPGAGSELVRVVGQEAAERLAARADRLPARVPTAKPWLAEAMKSQGLPVEQIARRLHVSNVAVRRWLKKAEAERIRRDQYSLF